MSSATQILWTALPNLIQTHSSFYADYALRDCMHFTFVQTKAFAPVPKKATHSSQLSVKDMFH